MRIPARAALLLPVALLLSCGDTPGPIELGSDAWVGGMAFIDRDGDGVLTSADGPAAGVLTALLLQQTGDTIARAVSRSDGTFAMTRVPAGRYRLVASRGAAGDTVDVLHIDSAEITLAARDSVARIVRLGFPRVTTAAARAAPVGRRVTVDGIALNGWSTFGDSVIHVADRLGALRALRVLPTAVQAGDSISVIGTVGTSGGHVVLADARARVVAPARGLPAADSIGTKQVGDADGGRIPDGQARVAGAVVRDTGSLGVYRRIGVDDGSGRVEVLLHRNIPFPAATFATGATVSYTGVLVPAASGAGWQLRPRSVADVIGGFPLVLAAQTRTLPAGSRVHVEGIALNGWSTFGDSTVHVADRSGAVRALRVPPSSVLAGDSVQVTGTIATSGGSRALFDAVISIIALARGVPPLDSVGTGAAANAGSGVRADGAVRIAGAVIVDTATLAGERILGVDDGSGRLEIALDPQIVFGVGPYVRGATLSAAGVLVPAGAGVWRLKPRERAELNITFNTITVAQARALPAGQQVVLQGLALNATTAFGDSTVHIMDATGALRAVRVVGAVAAGDSIRLVGVTSTRDGARVIGDAAASVLRAGVGLPAPDSIATVRARTADSGTRDAAQVRVGGTIIGTQNAIGGDVLFTVDDGSGSVEVLFDGNITFAQGPYVVGALLDATGVLVPTGSGAWRVKPRMAADVRASYVTATIAQARTLATGKVVQIRAIALNGWSDFGDASVHLLDATGTLRSVNLAAAQIFRGDSVLVHGVIETRNGQPVLRGLAVPPGPGPVVLLQGVGAPAPDSVSTALASRADGGRRDADQLRVRGRISAATQSGSDMLLTISDGSGDLVVRLQPAQRFPAATYRVNDTIRVSGVLVPTPAGAWELKPRSLDEIAVVGGSGGGD